MAHRTIPPPNENDVAQAERIIARGNVAQLAQLLAELRHKTNLIHDPRNCRSQQEGSQDA